MKHILNIATCHSPMFLNENVFVQVFIANLMLIKFSFDLATAPLF